MRIFKAILFFLISSICFSQTNWFDVDYEELDSSCDNAFNEIFISEVYDSKEGSDGVIEIYNPTTSTINLSLYRIRRSGEYGSNNWDNYNNSWNGATGRALSGTLAPGATYLIVFGGGGIPCPNGANITLNSDHGINANDQIQLLKDTTIIDDVRTPNSTGFSHIRKPNAEVPRTVYNLNDWTTQYWNTVQTLGCTTLGLHEITPLMPPRINYIRQEELCQDETRVGVDMVSGGASPYTFQLEGGSGNTYTSNNGLFSAIPPDTYILTVTDENGCTITAEFTMTGPIQTSTIQF